MALPTGQADEQPFFTVNLNQEIPTKTFTAVSAILSRVYEFKEMQPEALLSSQFRDSGHKELIWLVLMAANCALDKASSWLDVSACTWEVVKAATLAVLNPATWVEDKLAT